MISAVHLEVVAFSIPSDFMFVRGYMDPLIMDVQVENKDLIYSVVPVPEGRNNFNVSLTYSDVDVTAGTPSVSVPGIGSILGITSDLPRNASLVIKGRIEARISRSDCATLNYLCFELFPGYGASYTQPDNVGVSTQCLDITTHKNCEGILTYILIIYGCP